MRHKLFFVLGPLSFVLCPWSFDFGHSFVIRISSFVISFELIRFVMHVNYSCPSCQQANRAVVSEETEQLQCSACSWTRPLPAAQEQRTHPQTCFVCGCRDLWRRKNFPQQLGVAIAVLAAVLSTIAWAKHEPLWAFGILMGSAALDMLLFTFMPDVLVCYRCGARYLKFNPAGETPHFNLEMAEKHRQEKIRLKESS